jgi:hypothetical protein
MSTQNIRIPSPPRFNLINQGQPFSTSNHEKIESPRKSDTSLKDAQLEQVLKDHPVLYEYMMLNEHENISTTSELQNYYNSGRYNPAESS